MEASETGLLEIEQITRARFHQAYRLRLEFNDKPRISFTDLTSFVTMNELGIQKVLTGDAHFEQVRFGFQIVPSPQSGS